MNVRQHNQDLRILQQEASRPRFGARPGWGLVDWRPTPHGGNMVFLRNVVLPPTCRVPGKATPITDIKIEAPPNLYEPAGRGRLHFYRNVWMSPGIQVRDPHTRGWTAVPRLFSAGADNFAYLCIHAGTVPPGKNVLDFIKVLDLFLTNPGLKAAPYERL